MKKACDCKCIVCGKKAVAFWPLIDPDIPANPYCRKCLDDAKIKMLIHTFGQSKQEAKALLRTTKILRHE